MEELTLIQKFDAVLKALYDISGKRPTFGRIMALLRARKQNVHWGEVWDILNKMRRDYLIHPEIKDITSKIPDEVIHLITFEGKLMYERNGLKGKIWRENFTRIWISSLSILTLIIALASFYYSTKVVSDDTVNKYYEPMRQSLLQQDTMKQLERDKIIILQRIAGSVSIKK